MIAIVDYRMGNLRSVENALGRLGAEYTVTSDPGIITSASKVLLPGVGNAAEAMSNLRNAGLVDVIRGLRKPVLGICIGMQVLCRYSEEGDTGCIGLFDTDVRRFTPEPGLKIPHMGWNQVNFTREHPIMKGIKSGSDFYYVHSYHPVVPAEYSFAETTYGTQTFQGLIGKDNLIASQFHQEKSGEVGLAMLKNFCDWKV